MTPRSPVFKPGDPLYQQVKAGFKSKNTTFTAWCAANGVNRANARQALLGSWNGRKAKDLRQRICTAAKLQPTRPGRKNGSTVPPSQRAYIKRLRAAGHSMRQIATYTGISRSTILRILKKGETGSTGEGPNRV